MKSATKVVLGIAIGNALEIILSVMGISLLANLGKKYPVFFYLVCAFLLFYLGFKSLIGVFKSNITSDKPVKTDRYIIAGFGITLCNPKALIFWPLMLSPVVINYNVACKVLIAMYFIIATFVFVWFDVYLVSIFKEKMVKGLKYMQAFFGVVMVGFGVLMIWKVYIVKFYLYF